MKMAVWFSVVSRSSIVDAGSIVHDKVLSGKKVRGTGLGEAFCMICKCGSSGVVGSS